MRKLVIFLVGVASAAAVAHSQAPSTGDTAERSRADMNQVVCVKQADTGSRLGGRRICRTRAQWAEEQDESRKVTERIQSMKTSQCGAGSKQSVC